MRWRIGVEQGGEVRFVETDKSQITFGRVDGNEVCLRDATVSRRHARLVIKDGRFIIVDLASSSGTYVGGEQLRAPRVIAEGERFRIGQFNLWIEDQYFGQLLAEGESEPSPRELELIELIAQAPEDDEPRLVYADYLMDAGNPRGEFINLQLELANKTGSDAHAVERRLHELAERQGDPILAGLVAAGARFERGFLAVAPVLSAYRRERLGSAIYRLTPTVYELGGALRTVYRSQHLDGQRFTPLSSGSALIIRFHDRGDADRHLGYRRGLDSNLLPDVFGLVEMHGIAGSAALATRCADGESMDSVFAELRRGDGVALCARAREVGARIAQLIAQIHDAGGLLVVGLDPREIMLEQGAISIANLSCATEVGSAPSRLPAVSGSPPYRALETMIGREISQAGDVYAVAALIYAAVSGRHPVIPERQVDFAQADLIEIIASARPEPLPDLGPASRELSSILLRALSPEASDRPTAAVLANELGAAQ